jgi:hypothetical protein
VAATTDVLRLQKKAVAKTKQRVTAIAKEKKNSCKKGKSAIAKTKFKKLHAMTLSDCD